MTRYPLVSHHQWDPQESAVIGVLYPAWNPKEGLQCPPLSENSNDCKNITNRF